jgi:gas vesicle protein
MLLPGIGTVIGGAIGAMAGGFGGGELGKIVGKELGKSSVSADAKSKETKLADAGTSNDQEIIASLRTMAAEAEKSRKLQEQSVRHLDDINNNVDNSGPPSFYG